MFLRKSCSQDPNYKQKFLIVQEFCLWRVTKIHPHSKDEGPRDIKHKMSTVLDKRKSSFGSQQLLWFHTWFIVTLCYKMRQLFCHTMRQKFITKSVSFFITKCDSSYKTRQFYHKMRQLLQNTMFITKCVSTPHTSQFQWNL